MEKSERDNELEHLGSLMFSREEASIILDGGDDPYLRGRLKCEAEVRKSIMELAKAGSSPAQAMAMRLIENARIQEA